VCPLLYRVLVVLTEVTCSAVLVLSPHLHLSAFFPLCLTPIMSSMQIQCHGCNRNFTPQGLSQHVNRTPHPRCCAVYITSQLPSVSTSVPRMVFPPALDPSHISCNLGDDTPGDEYSAANDRAPNPAIGVHSLDGMFTTVTKVKPSEHASESHMYYR
jgi:hypothetical protein